MEHNYVLDIGSCSLKLGVAGEDNPAQTLSSIIATTKSSSPFITTESEWNSLLSRTPPQQLESRFESLYHPIHRGIIQDFDAFRQLFDYSVKSLNYVMNSDTCLFFTDALLNPLSQREKLAEIFFEEYNIGGLLTQSTNACSWMSSGRNTVLSVELGHGVTTIAPFFDGSLPRPSMMRLPIGGGDVTDYLSELMTNDGYYFNYTSTQGKQLEYKSLKREMVRLVKENLVEMPLDPEAEIEQAQNKSYRLPDGSEISLGATRMQAAELMMQPQSFFHKLEFGIAEAIFKSIEAAPADAQRDLYGNIFLSGGNSAIPGLKQRITKELTNLAPASVRVRVVAFEEKNGAWIGGSIFGSLSSSMRGGITMTNSEYQESGVSYIRRMRSLTF